MGAIDVKLLAEAEAYARAFFAGDATGHDVHHTLRVARLARRIAAEEGADEGACALAALLHDVDDAKLSPDTAHDLGNARAFLAEHGVDGEAAARVLAAIAQVSFSKNGDSDPSSLEAACVRDADRLDAIGAIGVARAFAYGGAHGRALHDPDRQDAETSIAHFYDKLLKLSGMMRTDAGKRLAKGRDETLRAFLDSFLAEWDAAC